MSNSIRNTVLVCLVVVVAVLALTVYRQVAPPVLSPEALRELGGVVYDDPVELSDFQLTDQHGQTFGLEDLRGQWSLIFFGYTNCPDICPLTMMELSQFYGTLEEADSPYAEDTQVILVTVDPMRDSPEDMGNYVSSFHPDFVGLTGDYEEIADLASQLYIAHAEPPTLSDSQSHEEHDTGAAANDYLVNHSGNILIINPEGDYQGFFVLAVQDDELTVAYESIRAGY